MIERTWDMPELIWTVAMMIGVIVNLRLLGKALEKRSAVLRRPKIRPDGPRILAADRYIRNDAGRLLFFGIGLFVGFWAMAVMPGDITYARMIATLLITMVVILLGNSVWDLLDEPRMQRLLDAEDRRERDLAQKEGRADIDVATLLAAMQERRRARHRAGTEAAP